jgi:IclR family transcriptional regulator, acetate operon repressor
MTVRSVQAVSNALLVIEAITREQPVGVSQLARTTGLDKSLVQRLLITLNDSGWIVPSSGTPRRWQLSSKPLNLLRNVRPLHLLEAAAAEMVRFRDEINETVILSAPQRGEMVILDIARSETPLRIEINEAFAFSKGSAGSIAFMAALPTDDQVGLAALEPDGQRDAAVLAARARGFAILRSGDLVNIASALLDEDSYPFAVLSIVVPRFRMKTGDEERFGQLVAESARRVSLASPGQGSPGQPTTSGATVGAGGGRRRARV